MFWALKRTVSLRRFFLVPTTYVLFETYENTFYIAHSYLEACFIHIGMALVVVRHKIVCWQQLKQYLCCKNAILDSNAKQRHRGSMRLNSLQ